MGIAEVSKVKLWVGLGTIRVLSWVCGKFGLGEVGFPFVVTIFVKLEPEYPPLDVFMRIFSILGRCSWIPPMIF